MRGYTSNIHLKPLFAPKAAVIDNTAQVSSIIDTKGFNSLTLAWIVGTMTDADATFTALVEHGDAANLSDAAAVADEDLAGTEALAGFNFADDGECRKIGYIGNKRYVRVTITPVNNTGDLFLGGMAILTGAQSAPTANPPS